jgi:transposase
MTEAPEEMDRPRRARRRRTLAEKQKIVEETFEAGTSVSIVARRHDINANQLFAWRRDYKKEKMAGGSGTRPALIPIGVIGEPPRPSEPPNVQKLIEIEVSSGVKVRIDGEIRLPALELVLNMVRGLV